MRPRDFLPSVRDLALRMNGRRRKVEVVHPERCIACGACVVQCPDDALRLRFDDGRIAEPDLVRSTRLNMLGRRTVRVRSGASGPPA